MRGDEDGNPQSSEEMVDRVGKQMVPVNVARRHLIINKTCAKGDPSQVSTDKLRSADRAGEARTLFLQNQHCWVFL